MTVTIGKTDTIKYLLENDVKINAKNNAGQTSLHLTTKSRDNTLDMIGVLNVLIEKGAEINIQDNNGDTPIFNAVENG